MTWMRLGELLMHQQVCTRDQLLEAWEQKVMFGDRLGTNLLACRSITEETLARALGQQHQTPSAYGKVINVDTRVARLLDEKTADHHSVVPHHIDGENLYLLTIDPSRRQTLSAVEKIVRKRVIPVVVCEARMWQLLYAFYGLARAMRPVDLNIRASEVAPETPSSVHALGEELTSEAEFHAMYANRMDEGGTAPGLSDEGEAVLEDISHEGPALGGAVIEVPVASHNTPVVVGEVSEPSSDSPPLALTEVLPETPLAPAPQVAPVATPQTPAHTPLSMAAQPTLEAPPVAKRKPSSPTLPPAQILAPPEQSSKPNALAPRGEPNFVVMHTGVATSRIHVAAPQKRAPWASIAAFIERNEKKKAAEKAELERQQAAAQAKSEHAQKEQEGEAAKSVLKHTLFMPAISLSELPEHNPQDQTKDDEAALGPLDFESTLAVLQQATKRSQIARAALRFLRQDHSRTAILNVHPQGLGGWLALAEDEDFNDELISHYRATLDERSVFTSVIHSREVYVGKLEPWKENGEWVKASGRKIPESVLVAPVILDDKVINLVYADNGHAENADDIQIAQVSALTQSMSVAYAALMKTFSFTES